MNYSGLIVIAVGLFCLIASIKEWAWFFNNRKAQKLINIISYKGARVFYGLIGIIFLFAGIINLIKPLINF